MKNKPFILIVKIQTLKANMNETQPSDIKYGGLKSNSIDSKDKPPLISRCMNIHNTIEQVKVN